MADKKKDKKAEEAIFGGGEPASEKGADTLGVVSTAPVAESKPAQIGSGEGNSITMGAEQFQAIMQRMSELEGIALSSIRSSDPKSVFNPLAEVKGDHTARVAFYGNLLVTGYKESVEQDGHVSYVWEVENETNGKVRTLCTLILMDTDTGEITEQTVDYLNALKKMAMVEVVIKERRDIGKIVEQGIVKQMVWDGNKNSLVATGAEVMSGAKVQKFVFKVDLRGKIYELPQNVINIKP